MPTRRPAPPASAPLLHRAAVVAGVSFFLAVGLVAYTFGWGNGFLLRLFNAFFVLFLLLAVTFLGVVPFVSWAAANWFGAGWQETVPLATSTRPRTRKAAPAPAEKLLRHRVRSNSSSTPNQPS